MSEVKYSPSPESELLQKIYLALQTQGIEKVRPTRFITGTDGVDLYNVSKQEEDVLAAKSANKPFWLLEGAHPEHKLVLTKIRNKEDVRHEGHNEVVFYREIRENLIAALPEQLQGRVDVPDFKAEGDVDGEHNFVQMEFAEGDRIGLKSSEVDPPGLSLDEYGVIARLIKEFQHRYTPEYIQSNVPDMVLNSEGACPTYQRCCEMWDEHASEYAEWLGEDLFQKISDFLTSSAELFSNPSWVFTNVDINVANLIRTSSGKIEIFDWERLKLIDNAAAAYSYIPLAHWKNPELQRQMYQEAINLNRDVENFQELLRFNVIFYRYLRVPMMYYWLPQKKEGVTDERREELSQTCDRFRQLADEAVRGEGVWAH